MANELDLTQLPVNKLSKVEEIFKSDEIIVLADGKPYRVGIKKLIEFLGKTEKKVEVPELKTTKKKAKK